MKKLNKNKSKNISEKDTNDMPTGNTDWKILIVDDEEAIHNITKRVLKDLVFQGRNINFISAYSGAEAQFHCQRALFQKPAPV